MAELRQQLIDCARQMAALGLNRGTAGNLSVRLPPAGEAAFLITPSGMAYDALQPEDVVQVRLDGATSGRRLPSSEWRFHRDLYARRADAGAILHAHSPFATSLACLRRDIPAFHYMIARFGGDSVRCSDYATFGTQELSAAVLRAIDGRCGCLLANHGMLVVGRDLPQALALGGELEALCEQYWRACQIAPPVLLDAAEMARVLAKFASYGQQS
ncbi:class II aldolase/adducin family protein [Accumulibacter sp.]|uniref:class II aldolase/adducin family protein n=1 Tax=Accumulibacter sp. TaxID=2053492 RepID=UPI0025E6B1C0|nr:class II aldolase/adducin family protein [Accumulibacter sp.]MCM8611918.1 class II aldolase/adducin family protein [Accumulibacter sp.]MCM8635540.1 class II aldolase/adducin family protein [Accumulibacter sp.]MCM8639118.1 class II aldolase/adducin family protein [Accumulibacter sp.]